MPPALLDRVGTFCYFTARSKRSLLRLPPRVYGQAAADFPFVKADSPAVCRAYWSPNRRVDRATPDVGLRARISCPGSDDGTEGAAAAVDLFRGGGTVRTGS